MAKELIAIRTILDRLVADEESEELKPAFKNLKTTNSFVIMGVAQAGSNIRKNFINLSDSISPDLELESIECKKMSNRELILASRYAYRELVLSVHHSYAKKAVNFSINTLSVKGLTERAKEIMRIVWWCDTQIKEILADIKSNPEDENGNYLSSFSGYVEEMKLINDTIRY
ncbi:hypothetical protein KQI68_07345 [Peptoniphilus sp. MSJ-1]|uniref:Uncharacterized protein n=1 Tax=Peptoniphilus ovalis TaxID=2841503 RepID=A0ABS6FHK4_9FIRM|nr:hypothetical protein [Peptoniphilus ovalis]MBU5669654.1 hypothetical protein [Peptoniphilus ovalis]